MSALSILHRTVLILAITVTPLQVFAGVTDADVHSVLYDAPFYDTEDGCGGNVNTNNSISISDTSKQLIANFPSEARQQLPSILSNIDKLKSEYQAGEKATGVDWRIWAALHFEEANNSPTGSMLGGEQLGTKALDSNNTPQTLVDSIKIASRIDDGNLQANYKIDIRSIHSASDVQKLMVTHNRGGSYKVAGLPPTASPYVYNDFDGKHVNMVFPNIPGETLAGSTDRRVGAFVVYVALGGDGTFSDNPDCSSSGGVGIGDKGFIFPLKTTQAAIIKGVRYGGRNWQWCYKSSANCHHDYNAADIHISPGTPVIAAVAGTLVRVDTPAACSGITAPHVRIKGDDGKWYFYQHMKPGSIKVHLNEHIDAGDQIGVVGPGECAENTGPHLHFDISPVENGFTRPSPIATSTLINPQPILISAFNQLPEK